MSGYITGLLCALTWAIGSISMRNLSKKLDPFTLNAPRSLVAGVFLLAFSLIIGRGTSYSEVSLVKLALLIGSVWIGGGLGDSIYITSMARIGVARSYAISSTYPVLTLLFSILFLSEHATPGLAVGLALVLAGVVLLSRSDAPNEQPEMRADTTGVWLSILAAVCWATANVIMAPAADGLDPIIASAIRVPAFSLLAWGVVGARRTWPQLRQLNLREWLSIAVGGLIGWGFGSILYVSTVTSIGVSRTSILTSTAPLFAVLLSVMLFNEKPTRRTLLGSVLTVCGVALVSI